MYSWLADSIAQSQVVVTGSRRLARELRHAYDEQQLAMGLYRSKPQQTASRGSLCVVHWVRLRGCVRGVNDMTRSRRDGFTIDCFMRALLLVKPSRGRGVELETSSRHTQLLDLRATINALANLGGPPGQGHDILAESFPQHRPLSLIAGSYQPRAVRKPRGQRRQKFVHLCQSKLRGHLNHFVRTPPDGGWTIRPNLDISC